LNTTQRRAAPAAGAGVRAGAAPSWDVSDVEVVDDVAAPALAARDAGKSRSRPTILAPLHAPLRSVAGLICELESASLSGDSKQPENPHMCSPCRPESTGLEPTAGFLGRTRPVVSVLRSTKTCSRKLVRTVHELPGQDERKAGRRCVVIRVAIVPSELRRRRVRVGRERLDSCLQAMALVTGDAEGGRVARQLDRTLEEHFLSRREGCR
jgi:hypothetical protein